MSTAPVKPVDEETDPTGRYVKYKNEFLGKGAFKEVHKGYDRERGIEVAWNQIPYQNLSHKERKQLLSEVDTLKSVSHNNIIRFQDSWTDKSTQSIIFISELMSSGTLKEYITRTGCPRDSVLRRWCRQILSALSYLHNSSPKIIHRDLKCDNIFINGYNGEVKIGDLGLSTKQMESRVKSVIGTPEFMAPELYDESYDEKVDIYAFGMCVLEMVTGDYPYSECTNAAQVYKKVSNKQPPKALDRVQDPTTRDFIKLCINPDPHRRPSADELLSLPFLQIAGTDKEDDEEGSFTQPMARTTPYRPAQKGTRSKITSLSQPHPTAPTFNHPTTSPRHHRPFTNKFPSNSDGESEVSESEEAGKGTNTSTLRDSQDDNTNIHSKHRNDGITPTSYDSESYPDSNEERDTEEVLDLNSENFTEQLKDILADKNIDTNDFAVSLYKAITRYTETHDGDDNDDDNDGQDGGDEDENMNEGNQYDHSPSRSQNEDDLKSSTPSLALRRNRVLSPRGHHSSTHNLELRHGPVQADQDIVGAIVERMTKDEMQIIKETLDSIGAPQISLDGQSYEDTHLDDRDNEFDVAQSYSSHHRQLILALSLTLNLKGEQQLINFPFNLSEDTALSVAQELASGLNITDQDTIQEVARLIEVEKDQAIEEDREKRRRRLEHPESSSDSDVIADDGEADTERDDDEEPDDSLTIGPVPDIRKLTEEQQRLDEARRQEEAEAAQREEEERRRMQEEERKRAEAEKQRLEKERQRQLEEERRIQEEERKRREEEELARRQEEERQRLEEEKRKKEAAEKARLEEEKKAAAEKARIEEEKKAAAEKARIEEEKKAAAEKARIEEEKKAAAEKARLEEEKKAEQEKQAALSLSGSLNSSPSSSPPPPSMYSVGPSPQTTLTLHTSSLSTPTVHPTTFTAKSVSAQPAPPSQPARVIIPPPFSKAPLYLLFGQTSQPAGQSTSTTAPLSTHLNALMTSCSADDLVELTSKTFHFLQKQYEEGIKAFFNALENIADNGEEVERLNEVRGDSQIELQGLLNKQEERTIEEVIKVFEKRKRIPPAPETLPKPEPKADMKEKKDLTPPGDLQTIDSSQYVDFLIKAHIKTASDEYISKQRELASRKSVKAQAAAKKEKTEKKEVEEEKSPGKVSKT
ncbi:putative serine/threonine protein kinase [Blattamonas nauphoetae]|uniref:Serine/threonine protein kinase n=1 Tax=Blattamonas nauphoetae TaxID=2049346 RepID=A0ABQ9YC38_9EUKA|nr:putative serine/threonine protein kinase [Blattamonas nauphoetae]